MKAADRLSAAIELLEKRIDARASDSDNKIQDLQQELEQARQENSKLKRVRRDVGQRLDAVIEQLSSSLEN